jgi:hypothetical protein
MTSKVWQSRWVLSAALLIGGLVAVYYALVGVYYAVVGRPTTPMTSVRANRLFGQALRTGQNRAEVETWLASEGIPRALGFRDRGIGFDLLQRRDDLPQNGPWIDGRGNQTVAECAGLKVDSVCSLIRVSYPDADRSLLCQTQITVYLFFDGNDRLLKHWVDEFYLMP